MVLDDLLSLHKQGSNARAIGLKELDNPYYRTDKSPAKTGDSVEEFNAKANAWRDGWLLEDSIR